MSQTRNPHESKAAAPDATVEYSRAALNLLNRELHTLLKAEESETNDAEDDAKPQAEWYFRLAGMLNEHHPGYVYTGSEKNKDLRLDRSSTHKQKVQRIVPLCQQCGSPIIPGTEYTQCRVVSINKRKRKRQPRKIQSNKQQPEGLEDHPDLEIPKVKNAKNKLVLTCQLCGDKCIIPALERRIKERALLVKQVGSPAVKEDLAMGDEISKLDFIRLDKQVPHPMDPPPNKSKTSKKGKPQKKRKKKKESGASPLTNFLNSLNN